MAAAATGSRTLRAPRRRAPARRGAVRAPARGGIRWDRLGRVGLLLVLAVIVLLYASPMKSWITQKQTATEHSAELRALESENARLEARARALTRSDAIAREARRLGMVRQGERAYVIENLRR